jgi:glutathione S-transferase
MITVHHLEDSRSLRILWLLEELGTKYEIKLYAMRTFWHPRRCVPYIL